MVINVTQFNASISHEKKNQIRGEERERIMELLKKDKAQVVASKLPVKELRLGDIDPPYMPTTTTLRKIKSRANDELIFYSDPVLSLREMKYNEQ